MHSAPMAPPYQLISTAQLLPNLYHTTQILDHFDLDCSTPLHALSFSDWSTMLDYTLNSDWPANQAASWRPSVQPTGEPALLPLKKSETGLTASIL